MKKIGIKFYLLLFLAAFVLLPHNVHATTHDFSLKAYDYDIIANDWDSEGTGDEIEDGGTVKPGQIFQVALYYKAPKTIELTQTLQTGIKYDSNLVEPIYEPEEPGKEHDVYVYVDETTSAYGGLWPPKSSTQKRKTNWVVQYHDDVDTEIIKFLIADSQLDTYLTEEGVLAYVYFKVKDNVRSGTDIDLHVDYAYTKAVGVVPGGLPKSTSGITLKVNK